MKSFVVILSVLLLSSCKEGECSEYVREFNFGITTIECTHSKHKLVKISNKHWACVCPGSTITNGSDKPELKVGE